jgi:hypothetical protein
MILVKYLAFFGGVALILATIYSAIQTFVLPRSAPDILWRAVFVFTRWLFDLRLKLARDYLSRDRIMAFFAPTTLLLLLPIWLALISLGYAMIYWALGETWYDAIRISGSSLLTLGFAVSDSPIQTALEFTEATIGLMLVALLIAYLPSMYSAFSRREAAVTLLEVRAGNPPSAVEMLLRFHRIHGLDQLGVIWLSWENWFADVEESHTSLAALVFFRSPQHDHSWVTASGAVLDAAALTLACVDIPHNPQADLCLRAGYLTLRRISDFFGLSYHPDPHFPEQPVSIERCEFDEAVARLAQAGLPIKEDREQAWNDFAGWRVNYDTVLIALAGLTLAPEAPWSSDRPIPYQRPSVLKAWKVETRKKD